MLSKTAEYALRAVVWLAREPLQTASADELFKTTKVPRRYLNKVLQDLVRTKLIRSQSGPGGGYALARATTQLTVFDVVNAVAPVERIRSCPLGLSAHENLCPLHNELDKVYAATEAALRRVTIAKLVRSTRPLCEVRK